MLKQLVKKTLDELLPTLKGEMLNDLLSHLGGIYKMDPKAQYMIIVKDDETAQQLVQALNERFDPESRIVVLAAEDVNLIQITKRRS